MDVDSLDIYTREQADTVSGPEETHRGVHFHLANNRAEWSSADFTRSEVIDSAKVSLTGPNVTTGRMSLRVEGWATTFPSDQAVYRIWVVPIPAGSEQELVEQSAPAE